MTGREANEYIGKVFRYPIHKTGIEIEVRVDDWKQAHGHDLFLCIPVAGTGSTWLRSTSLRSSNAT